MSIRAVFRVQCDGPGKEWLSWPQDYVLGTDLPDEILVAEPTAIRACNWPSDHAARVAALGAGWATRLTPGVANVQWWCPGCQKGPGRFQRTAARFIVTGRFADPGVKGIPYASVDVAVQAYQDKAVRLRVTSDVWERFNILHKDSVTDTEAFWIWTPDGDRIEGTNEG